MRPDGGSTVTVKVVVALTPVTATSVGKFKTSLRRNLRDRACCANRGMGI
jgi:hypothetical protein